MPNKYYITTPIYYVNDAPHIGHAYSTIASDVIARSMRLNGVDVMFLTGTDEHGQKVAKAASNCGLDPQHFTDKVSASFYKLMISLNISNDDFIRTTQERHKKAVAKFWQILQDNGYIYLDKYEGWYALQDEAFYTESELTQDGLAPTGTKVTWMSEPSYFFALSKLQDRLLEFYDKNPGFIKPEYRMCEVTNFVKMGLRDLSISRTNFTWGITVPNDTRHIIYVWIDALVNYISALGFAQDDKKYHEFWPANVHIIGKDILRFHAVYWPAFLMAAGLEPPKCIMAHGWWLNDGKKISKSIGNVIDPLKLSEEFGVDQLRYFLMREITFGSDGNYTAKNLVNRNNSELANKIGNLMQRTTAFIHKYCESKVPNISPVTCEQVYNVPLLQKAMNLVAENEMLIQNFAINNVLNNIISIAEDGNSYIDCEAPWVLLKTDANKMKTVLYVLLESLRYIAIMLQPFTPCAADKMLDQLAINRNLRTFKHLTKEYAILPGTSLPPPSLIFPKLSESDH